MRMLSYVEQMAVSGGRLFTPPEIEASKPRIGSSVTTAVSTATSTELYNFIGSISHNTGIIIGNIDGAYLDVLAPDISNSLSIKGYKGSSSIYIGD